MSISDRPAQPAHVFLTLLIVLATAHVGTAAAADGLGALFTEGKGGLAFRYRLETVDQDGFAKDATASTLRTRLNFKSGTFNGFSFFAEYDYLLEVGPDDFNAGAGNTPNRSQYPVVADPDGWDLNQAYLQWTAKGTLLRGGRERIIYDNARFVGNVGWRQNEQTYDGLYFQHKAGGIDLQAAWVGRVNRIFGRDVPAGRADHDSWLLNAGRSWEGIGKLTGYWYNIHDEEVPASSNISYGLRFAGKLQTEAAALGYIAEYAHQTDAHDNPVNYSADYYRVDLSYGIDIFTPYIGYESLGGDEGRAGAAFRTPLATLHAFNGWADQFLSTPGAGLNDLFLGVKGKLGAWSWNVLYHDFEAESGSRGYGDEIDASLGRKLFGHYGLLFKAARFDAEAGSSFNDTTKLWLQLTADF